MTRWPQLRRNLQNKGSLPTLEQKYSALGPKTWPALERFWCSHYKDSQGNVIPDGAECCFWHWRGMPRRWPGDVSGKGEQRHPLYPWQERVLKDIDAGYTYFFILKPPKMGATELFISYAIWKALTDKTWGGGQVGILAGFNANETEQTIARAKDILAIKDEYGVPVIDMDGKKQYRVSIHQSYNNKREFSINNVRFLAHPAAHYDAVRGKPNMRMLLGDEIAFFIRKKEEQKEIKSAFEHYKGGNTTLVVLVTTAGPVQKGFAYDVLKEENSLYRKHILDYQKDGLTPHPESKTCLLSASELAEKKEKSPETFKREQELQFGYDTGTVFRAADIDKAIELGKKYDPEKILPEAYKSQGIDEGFGDSAFGVCVVQEIENGILQVIHAEEHNRPMLQDEVYAAYSRIVSWPIQTTQCDAAQPPFISALKSKLGEDPHYHKIDKAKHRWMRVKPISFNITHKEMLGNAVILMERGRIAIHPKFENLISALRTATATDHILDKEQTSYDDLFDAFRLALKPYHVEGQPN